MKKTAVLSLFFLFCFSCTLNSQQQEATVYVTAEDKAIFERFISAMESKRALSTEDLILETARFFLDTPYLGGTLEQEPEGLVVNLRAFDCSTFVDNVYALTRTLKGDARSFEAYCNHLRQLRYREGQIGDYTDRLHYTSDWIYENQRKGLVKDVTAAIGGEPYPLRLDFMSTHPESYKQLNGFPERIARIQEIEKEINARSYYYIPEADINRLSAGMRNGDMVCFVTTINGLDHSHVGLIYWQGEKLTFIHASSSGKVIINEEPLSRYVERIKSNSGVMIVRFQD
ncbi:DUF1460 domain-containing protein [Parabacteroides sp. OttesenSCG-928-G07]|nr:DUF1460 domain-containing protein [Parabacteroides sp. OttesenSCG-928-G07]